MRDDEVSEYLKYPSIPPTIDGNTIVNNMPPLPRSPLDTLVDRTSKSIRAHVFRDHGSPVVGPGMESCSAGKDGKEAIVVNNSD